MDFLRFKLKHLYIFIENLKILKPFFYKIKKLLYFTDPCLLNFTNFLKTDTILAKFKIRLKTNLKIMLKINL